MRIKTIMYGEVRSIRPYETKRLELEAELSEEDEYHSSFVELARKVKDLLDKPQRRKA